MKVIDHSEMGTHTIIDDSKYPFVFSKNYSGFVHSQRGKLLLLQDENNSWMPVKLGNIRFLKTIQILFPPLRNSERLSREEEGQFVNKMLRWLKEKNIADRIVQPPPYCIFNVFPKGAQKADFGTYFIDLENSSEADLFQKIHPKHRNVIQNAMNKGGEIRSGRGELPVFYELYKSTMERSNMYCETIAYFQSFYEHLSNAIICSVIYYKGKPQGGLLMPYTTAGAYYVYGASADNIELTGAMNYLHWETMKDLKKRGVKRYDLVGARLGDLSGTKLEGIQKFKSRFGTDLEKGYLWKMDLSAFRCRIFDLLLKLRTLLNAGSSSKDIIDQENEKNIFVTK